jgi:hypothetical protein
MPARAAANPFTEGEELAVGDLQGIEDHTNVKRPLSG